VENAKGAGVMSGFMSYDEEFNTGFEPPYPGPSGENIKAAIAVREKEIEWNIRRLANLVLEDEDRQQTEDLVFELREEVESLKRCFNVA
jgi:hypothetical protein